MYAWPKLAGAKTVIGVIHLAPLPGTPFYKEGSFESILDGAVDSAIALRDGGADGCLIQTVDRVASVRDESDPARIASATLITRAVVNATGGEFRTGVQLMRNAVRASLAVARISGASFIRAGAIVGATLTPQGIVEADPLGVMEYRNKISASGVMIFADIHSMQFKWMGGGRTVSDIARVAVQVGATGVILGDQDEDFTVQIAQEVRVAVPDIPILLAGYTTHQNAARLLAAADGAFVGSCLEGGVRSGVIDRDRVESYMRIVRQMP